MSLKAFAFALCSVLLLTAVSVPRAEAASAGEIDADVRSTIDRFYAQIGGARELADKSYGILVFPSVVKAGFGIGGEYGEGALMVRGQPTTYYNTIGASFGFQLGVQARSVIIMFMTPEALDQFRRSKGWKVGVDGSVAIITVGVGGSIDTNKIISPGGWVHSRSQGADVQFDTRRHEDHPHPEVAALSRSRPEPDVFQGVPVLGGSPTPDTR